MSDGFKGFKPKEKDVATTTTVDDVHSKLDEKLMEIKDGVKLVDDVKNNPPQPGEMLTEIPEGSYAVDLDTLLSAQLVECPAFVNPMIIDHAVRTAVDIKDTYKPEKRLPNFNYMWIIVLIIGLVGLFFGASWL